MRSSRLLLAALAVASLAACAAEPTTPSADLQRARFSGVPGDSVGTKPTGGTIGVGHATGGPTDVETADGGMIGVGH